MPSADPVLCQCGCGQPAPTAQRTNRAKGHVKGQPARFRQGHGAGKWQAPVERYRVEDRGYETPCWTWLLATVKSTGYGITKVGRTSFPAHRRYWQEIHGPVPEGMHLDHLCRNRNCVNPDHLEAVTPAVNKQRGAGVKLCADQIPEIRRLLAEGVYQRVLAERFGVSTTAIADVKYRRTWKETS